MQTIADPDDGGLCADGRNQTRIDALELEGMLECGYARPSEQRTALRAQEVEFIVDRDLEH
jgi:hypothetical protein